MATVTSTLALQDKMSSTFSSINKAMQSTLNAMQSINKGTGNMSNAFRQAQKDIALAQDSLSNFNNSINQSSNTMSHGTSSANSLFSSLLQFSAVQKIFGMITSQIGSAISRLDTMNNYPKVMSNLGISAADSEASINRLSEGLQGLPTTLDEGALAVQRFTSANGNIGASTEMYLALNNAILAGGANMQVQSSAMEQLSQAYSKGRPDMMEWRTAMMAMPAQMKQIAKSMGYVSTDKLGEDLRKGKVSMNDFMNAVTELNTKGVDGFQSFEQQAKNSTGGINTSIAVMKAAITRGIADMVKTLNENLKAAGIEGGVGEIIANIGKTIESFLKKVGQIVGQIMRIIGPAVKWIKDNWGSIEPVLSDSIVIIGAVAGAWGLLNMVLYASPITWIIAGIMAIVWAIHTIVDQLNEVNGAVTETQDGFISASGVIMGVLFTIATFAYNNVIVPLWNMFAMVVNFIANCFRSPVASVKILFADMCSNVLRMVQNLVQGIEDLINQIPGVEVSLTGGIKGLLNDIAEVKAQEIKDSGYKEVMKSKEIKSYEDMFKEGYDKGKNFNLKPAKSAAGASTSNNIKALKDTTKGVTGNDKKGGKAVKTTTNDNLFTDEDMQLLLDVATRDYKLKYQQITPNVTLTFGDIRETADVDDILDEVAVRLEEIYDGNLEVANE